MLDPPSITRASTFCSAISLRALSMRPWRSLSAIGTMPAVIGFRAAIAGCTPDAAAGAACPVADGAAEGLPQPAAAAPAARAEDWRKRRREGFMAREGITGETPRRVTSGRSRASHPRAAGDGDAHHVADEGAGGGDRPARAA